MDTLVCPVSTVSSLGIGTHDMTTIRDTGETRLHYRPAPRGEEPDVFLFTEIFLTCFDADIKPIFLERDRARVVRIVRTIRIVRFIEIHP